MLARGAASAAAAAATLLAGCVIHHPVAASREMLAAQPSEIEPHQWPARHPETIFPVADDETLRSMRRSFGSLTRDGTEQIARREWSARHLGVFGQAYLTEIELEEPSRADADVRWSRMFWAHGSTLSPRDLSDLVRLHGPFVDLGQRGYLTIARLYEPIEAEPRGLIVYLTGIRGLTIDAKALRVWRARGWRVLVVTPPANIIRRDDPLIGQSPLETRENLGDTEAIESLGSRLARDIDSRLAEWAYSVEGVLSYLDADQQGRPPTTPTAVVGMSLGALALPATVARQPERFEAAVIIAGGANILEILERSPLARGGIRVRHEGGKLTEPQRHLLFETYLERTRLDPYAAAGHLADIPVLQIHATHDEIVPAELGELLHQRLGRPERLDFPVSHIVLAWILPSQAGRIENWISGAIAAEAE